jgi:predicted Ser/Thr protein kinase
MESIGRYQILGELGRGAMGIVYRATDPAIGRPVAIKTIKLADFTDPTERARLRDRLFREAQSAGILSHPNIVTVYDVGEQEELTYIAMEFVNGSTLEKLLTAGEPPAQDVILNVLRQTAAALDFAHKKGIVHRDIKPANIMIDEDGTAKITDFGVAKIAASQQLTQTGTVLGTPNYISPEQVQGKPVDGRADQFSLAVMTYEMLTGEKPFAGEHLTTVLYKIVSEEPVPPHNLNPSLGWPVAMVLTRAMSKDPAKRYASCTEFAAAVESALKSKKGWKALARGTSQNLPTSVVTSPGLGTGAATQERVPAEEQPGSKLWRVAAIVAVIAGLGALAYVGVDRWLSPSGQAAPAAETAPRQPATPEPAKPTPMPPIKQAQGTAQAASAAPPGTEPVAAAAPPGKSQPQQAKPPQIDTRPLNLPAPSTMALAVATTPAGATATLDNDPSKTCTAPCSFDVPRGRHTLAVSLAGFRNEMRIFDVTAAQEVSVNLTRMTGTLRVSSEPAGAQIYINSELRKETTPATLVLPVGKYVLVVEKSGRRVEQNIEVKDGVVLQFNMQLN